MDPVYYERVKETCLEFKEIFIGLGSMAEEKRLHESLCRIRTLSCNTNTRPLRAEAGGMICRDSPEVGVRDGE